MTKLLIARHGNTFDKGDILRRVGLRTDISLSNSGKKQSDALSTYLAKDYPHIEHIYCSELKRVRETAKIIADKQSLNPEISILPWLNEIDYGIDDGKPEQEVIQRLGQDAIERFEQTSQLPPGWDLDVTHLKSCINTFAQNLVSHQDKTYLVVTSNGIARFFSILLKNKHQQTVLKMPTASISLLVNKDDVWSCTYWGKRPYTID